MIRATVKRLCALCLCCVVFASCIGVTASAADNLSADEIALLDAYMDYYNECKPDLAAKLTELSESYDKMSSLLSAHSVYGVVLQLSNDLFYYLNDDGELYVSSGGAGGHAAGGRSGGGGRSRDDLYVTVDMFQAATADYADRYGPKTTAEYISWRTDKRNYGGTYGTGYNYVPLSFRADGCFCGNDSWVLDVYLVPFYFSTDYYYGTYQYHYYVYFDKDEDGNYILDDNGRRIGYIKCDYYNMTVTDSPVNTAIITDNYYTYPYLDIPAVYTTTYNLWRWKTVTDYISISHNTANYRYFYLDNISDIGFASYVSDDFTDMVYVSGDMCDGGAFYGAVSAHDADCSNMCDIGYYCSNEPIKMKLDVDWSKFAADDVVTLSGDTIYDCVITNNNGDTSTINEYITNNYTYITNNGGGEGGGSGSSSGGAVGGNVTVGGNIDVGGSVDVNVNVNVSDNEPQGDYVGIVDDYTQYLPDVAPEVTEYLSTTYSFLPPEVVALLIGGVAAAVLCRVLGR